jgi:hypothetical protein
MPTICSTCAAALERALDHAWRGAAVYCPHACTVALVWVAPGAPGGRRWSLKAPADAELVDMLRSAHRDLAWSGLAR